jgi:hypothetical protein
MNPIDEFNTTHFNANELKFIIYTSIRFNNNLLNKEQTTQWYDFCGEKSNNFDKYHEDASNYCEIQKRILDDYASQIGMEQVKNTEFYRFHNKFAQKMRITFKAYDVMRLDRCRYHDYIKHKYVLIVETSSSKHLVVESAVNDILLDCKEHIKDGNIVNIKPIKHVWEAGRWWSMIELGNEAHMLIKLTIKKPENGIRIFDYLDNLINHTQNKV